MFSSLGAISNSLAAALLAQAEAAPAAGDGAAPAAGAGDAAAPGGGGLMEMLPMFAIIGVLFYFMILRPQRREQSTRQSMLDQLKKNDRVVTAGGIYGVVVNVPQGVDEVTLRVDETSNTRIKVTRSSIVRVLGDEPATTAESKDNK